MIVHVLIQHPFHEDIATVNSKHAPALYTLDILGYTILLGYKKEQIQKPLYFNVLLDAWQERSVVRTVQL